MNRLLDTTSIIPQKQQIITLKKDKRVTRKRNVLLNGLMILGTTFLLATTGMDTGKIYWNLQNESAPKVAWFSNNPTAETPDIIKALLPFGLTTVVLTKASSSPWTVPMDWNPTNNSIWCIGAGGKGGDASTVGNYGGGGGALVAMSNYYNPAWAAGFTGVTFQITGQNTTATEGNASFNTTFDSSAFVARCGAGGSFSTAPGGSAASSVVPSGGFKNSGGNGGVMQGLIFPGAGGGGAGGISGPGGNGGPCPNDASVHGGGGGGGANNGAAGSQGLGSAGGNGGAGGNVGSTGGTGGASGVAGGNGGNGGGGGGGGERFPGGNGSTGNELDPSHGSGGGGGGGSGSTSTAASSCAGGAGANYGGGGGGGGFDNKGSGAYPGGAAGDGLVMITWVPRIQSAVTICWFD
jgi:hypothetical protein